MLALLLVAVTPPAGMQDDSGWGTFSALNARSGIERSVTIGTRWEAGGPVMWFRRATTAPGQPFRSKTVEARQCPALVAAVEELRTLATPAIAPDDGKSNHPSIRDGTHYELEVPVAYPGSAVGKGKWSANEGPLADWIEKTISILDRCIGY